MLILLQSILLLGNLEFEGEDEVKVANEDLLDELVGLLGAAGVRSTFMLTILFVYNDVGAGEEGSYLTHVLGWRARDSVLSANDALASD